FQDRNGYPVITVASSTALRWIRSADPVGVVLWDTVHDEGYFGWAVDSIAEWDMVMSRAKKVQIRLSRDSRFSSEIALRAGREAYLRHYNRLLIEANTVDKGLSGNELKRQKVALREKRVLLVSDVLAELGIFLRSARLPSEVRRQL